MSIFANAYGNFLSSALPYYQAMPGIVTPYGTLLKPGGRVAAYVRSTGALDGEDHFATSGMLVSTLQSAMARCRSGQGDIIYVLPGHTENVSGVDHFTNLVAGTQIIGVGRPGATNNPSLTWTAATATFLLDVANVTIMGMTLNFDGADAVAAPIIVTGAGCAMIGNHINHGSSTTTDSLIGVTLNTGSDDFLFAGNYSFTTSTAVITNVLAATATNNGLKILGNYASVPLTSTNGAFAIGVSATVSSNLVMAYNRVVNKSTGTAAVASFTDVAHTGIVHDNYSGVTASSDPDAITSGIVLAGQTNILVHFFQNFDSGEEKGTQGITSLAAATAT